jgi:acetyl-CoA C-acetyltransferase
MPALTAREDMTRAVVTRIMGEAAHDATGLDVAALDLYDIYSCFPAAVKSAAEGLGLAKDRTLTVTGGMPFAGGPLNNYVFQATCRAADLLRAGASSTALVSCVSGLYTKQGFTIWSAVPPARPFKALDVTADALRREQLLAVAKDPFGPGRITGYTILYAEGQPSRAIAVIDLPDGARTTAASLDAAVLATLAAREGVGMPVTVSNGTFALAR